MCSVKLQPINCSSHVYKKHFFLKSLVSVPQFFFKSNHLNVLNARFVKVKCIDHA